MAARGLQQHLTLPPAPDSARTARRFVCEVLQAARADEFADTAALLTSELVTNGIVHAHTDLRILVEATPTWVRVEVVDGNPQLPIRRDYDENATTGRGLEMVELLADDFGVDPLEDDGKRVWFRLGVAPGTPTTPAPAETDASGKTTLRLQSLPVALYIAWQEHADALLRDAMLAAFEDRKPAEHADYPMASRALTALAEGAGEIFRLRDEDVAIADVDIAIASDAVPWFPILRELLMHATEMSRAGTLLVPPSLPEIAAVRNWICDEVARQSAGLPPTPWMAYELDETVPLTVAAETLAEIRESATALIACDAANRIVAISQSAVDLLGWESPEDLEGRRLIAVIPQRLRDRHVAAFTRYLLDGSTTILNRDVQFPALRQDGSEVEVMVRVERRSDPATRALFVATVTPADAS